MISPSGSPKWFTREEPRSLMKEVASSPPHSVPELSRLSGIGSKQAMQQDRHLASV